MSKQGLDSPTMVVIYWGWQSNLGSVDDVMMYWVSWPWLLRCVGILILILVAMEPYCYKISNLTQNKPSPFAPTSSISYYALLMLRTVPDFNNSNSAPSETVRLLTNYIKLTSSLLYLASKCTQRISNGMSIILSMRMPIKVVSA